MAGVRRFQDLIAWQRGIALCKEVYRITARFPDSERFGLVSQMRRAAVSIPSNLAEGFGRESTPDMLRFFRTSRGSLFELQTQLILAVELGFAVGDDQLSELTAETDRLIQALIRSIETRQST